jgi:hypothetical protein
MIAQFWGSRREMMRVLEPMLALEPEVVLAKEVTLSEAYGFVNKRFDVPVLIQRPFALDRNVWLSSISPRFAKELVRMVRAGAGVPGTHTIALQGVGGAMAKGHGSFAARWATVWCHFSNRFATQAQQPANENYVTRHWHYPSPRAAPKGPPEAPPSYIGFPDLALPLRSYYGANLSRLRRIKSTYDPQDVFHYAQSIPPSRTKQ